MKQRLKWVICNLEEILSSAALAITLIFTTANVLLRYILKMSIPGYSDISVFCFAWAVFLGMSACYKRGMHYGVDFLMVILPVKGKKALRILIDAVVLGGCIVALCLSFKLFWATLAGTGRVSSYLGLSYGYMYLSGVLGFFFMVVHSVRFLIHDIRKLKSEEEGAQ